MPAAASRRAALGAAAALALALLGGCAAGGAPPLSAADDAAVARVQAWLDGLHGLQADFVQIWPNGAVGEGVLRFDPPGRLRLDYRPAGSMTLVANGGRIVFTDGRTGSTTRMPAKASPLGLLLDGRIRLGGTIRVTDVQAPPGVLQVSLARNDNPQAGLLTLTFADRAGGLVLTGAEGVDAEGRHTRFHFTNERTGEGFAPSIFSPAA